jgi:predicted metal-dependent hydrolase
VSLKHERISKTLAPYRDKERPAQYLAYFDYFNRQLFYEAHDLLEDLWLPARQGPNGSFYKGLIQLAGAFVHLQKGRLRPAAALFKLADTNLSHYAPKHEGLDIVAARSLIQEWTDALESADFTANPLSPDNKPALNPGA